MTSDEHIIVHQRADWKEVFPSFWDLAFGGVCGVGEKWELSAERELAEEAGLAVGTDTSALESLGSVAYEGDAGAVVGEAFVVISDVEPTCPDGEVVAIDRVPIAEIDGWLADRDVCPDSRDAVLPLLLNLKNS